MIPNATTNSRRQPGRTRSSAGQRGFLHVVVGAWFVTALGACQPGVDRPSRTESTAGNPAPDADNPPEFGPPDVALIRFACAGFDAAIAADAPSDRLLSNAAKHAVELGGPEVELATRRWALLPPQGLLEEIDRYERTGVNLDQCAGLRSHLERLAIRSSSH